MRECLPTQRAVEVIAHGLLRPLPTNERAEPPRHDERLRIGTYGNLVEPKGVLELVRAHGRVTKRMLMERLGMADRSASRLLGALAGRGLLARRGTARGAEYVSSHPTITAGPPRNPD